MLFRSYGKKSFSGGSRKEGYFRPSYPLEYSVSRPGGASLESVSTARARRARGKPGPVLTETQAHHGIKRVNVMALDGNQAHARASSILNVRKVFLRDRTVVLVEV